MNRPLWRTPTSGVVCYIPESGISSTFAIDADASDSKISHFQSKFVSHFKVSSHVYECNCFVSIHRIVFASNILHFPDGFLHYIIECERSCLFTSTLLIKQSIFFTVSIPMKLVLWWTIELRRVEVEKWSICCRFFQHFHFKGERKHFRLLEHYNFEASSHKCHKVIVLLLTRIFAMPQNFFHFENVASLK